MDAISEDDVEIEVDITDLENKVEVNVRVLVMIRVFSEPDIADQATESTKFVFW